MHISLKSRLADRFVAGQSLTAKLDHGLSVAELWRRSYDIKSSSHLHSSKCGGIVHRGIMSMLRAKALMMALLHQGI